jgi:hypothetical protein
MALDFRRRTRYGRSIEARYPSGKGEVCKTFMRGFDSHPRLQFFLLRFVQERPRAALGISPADSGPATACFSGEPHGRSKSVTSDRHCDDLAFKLSYLRQHLASQLRDPM